MSNLRQFSEKRDRSKETNKKPVKKLGFLNKSDRFPETRNEVKATSTSYFPKLKICDQLFCPPEKFQERFSDLCKLPYTPGPGDYNPKFPKKKIDANVLSTYHFPKFYGKPWACFSGPAPNAYNINEHPKKHCNRWRDYKSVFSLPWMCKLPKKDTGPSPNQYVINENQIKFNIGLPANTSFRSKVPQLQGNVDCIKGISSNPSPNAYFIDKKKIVIPKPVKIEKPQKIITEISDDFFLNGKKKKKIEKKKKCHNKNKPSWFFRIPGDSGPTGLCKEQRDKWLDLNRKSPGPADYNVFYP